MKLNVGCGRNRLDGWVNLDGPWNPKADLIVDLEKVDHDDNALEELRQREGEYTDFSCSHVLEHITNILPLMEWLWDLAAPEATMTIRAPYGTSDDAIEDPTHVRFFVLGSWQAFGQPYYWRADYGYRGDWRVDKVQLILVRNSEAWAAAEDGNSAECAQYVHTLRNQVAEQVAYLSAVKPARPPQQTVGQRPQIEMVW